MACRTWVKLLAAALGVAAVAGAGQLGLAYGLGIVRLTRVLDETARDQWTAQLAWVAWFAMTSAVLGALAGDGTLTGPLVLGGRSAGARVACRTAGVLDAAGVVALAFPLHPPGRPEKSRAAELLGVAVPVLVVQGATDAFGRPAEVEAVLPGRVHPVPGDHALAKDPAAVGTAVAGWLRAL